MADNTTNQETKENNLIRQEDIDARLRKVIIKQGKSYKVIDLLKSTEGSAIVGGSNGLSGVDFEQKKRLLVPISKDIALRKRTIYSEAKRIAKDKRLNTRNALYGKEPIEKDKRSIVEKLGGSEVMGVQTDRMRTALELSIPDSKLARETKANIRRMILDSTKPEDKAYLEQFESDMLFLNSCKQGIEGGCGQMANDLATRMENLRIDIFNDYFQRILTQKKAHDEKLRAIKEEQKFGANVVTGKFFSKTKGFTKQYPIKLSKTVSKDKSKIIDSYKGYDNAIFKDICDRGYLNDKGQAVAELIIHGIKQDKVPLKEEVQVRKMINDNMVMNLAVSKLQQKETVSNLGGVDLDMLLYLDKFRFSTTLQCGRAVRVDENRALQFLQRLEQLGYVKEMNVINCPRIYYVSEEGEDFLARFNKNTSKRKMLKIHKPSPLALTERLYVNHVASCLWGNGLDICQYGDIHKNRVFLGEKVQGETLVSESEIMQKGLRLMHNNHENGRGINQLLLAELRHTDYDNLGAAKYLFPNITGIGIKYALPDMIIEHEDGTCTVLEIEKKAVVTFRAGIFSKLRIYQTYSKYIREVIYITHSLSIAKILKEKINELGINNLRVVPMQDEKGILITGNEWELAGTI